MPPRFPFCKVIILPFGISKYLEGDSLRLDNYPISSQSFFLLLFVTN